MNNFLAAFRVALRQMLAVYHHARITEDERRPPTLVAREGKRIWREPAAKGIKPGPCARQQKPNGDRMHRPKRSFNHSRRLMVGRFPQPS
jgi:hypothetical protein